MHAAVQTAAAGSSSSSRGLSSGPSTPSQKSKANSESGLSMPTSKGKKRERAEQQPPDQSKREKSTKSEDSDSVHSRREQAMKPEDIAAITDKDGGGAGGLLGLASVDRLVSLMRQQESKVGAGGDIVFNRQSLAAVIAATDKEECLRQLVHLGGLQILDDWLQEAHRCKGEGGSPKEEMEKGGSSSEEVQLMLLKALDKLPVDLDALKSCSVGKSVNNLRSHKNVEIQRRARKIVEAWKKRVDAEMKLGDEAYKAGSSYTAVSWSAMGAGKQAAPSTPPDLAIETKNTLVKEETNNPTWSNSDTKSPVSTRSGSIITRNKGLLARGHAEAASRKEPATGKLLPDGGSGVESSSSQKLILRLPNLTRNQTDSLAQSSPSERLSAEAKSGAHLIEPIPDFVGDNNNEQDPLTSVGDGSSTPLALPPPLPVTAGEKTEEGVIGQFSTKENKNGSSDVVKTESRTDDHSPASGDAASPSSLCRTGAKDSPQIESGQETLVESPPRQECPGETVLRTSESLTKAAKEEEQSPTTQAKCESSKRCSPGNMEMEEDDGFISLAKCEEEEGNGAYVETTGAADSCDLCSASTSPGKMQESPKFSKIGAGNNEIATVSDEEDALEVACQVAKEVEQELEDSDANDHQEDGDALDPEKDKESTYNSLSPMEVDGNAGKVEGCLLGMDCSESKVSEDKREVAETEKLTGTDIVDVSGEQEWGRRMEAIESCRESKPAGAVEEVNVGGARPLFDLNEGAADETPLQGDKGVLPSLVRGGMDSANVAMAALVTATATKGAFTAVPDSLVRGRGEVGWKGAATRSAFRPAEPRHQKRPRLLDIDLNVADERLLDESAATLTGQSIVAAATTNTVNTVPWPVLDLNTTEVDVEEEEESEVSTLETMPSTSRKAMWDFDLNTGPSFEEAAAAIVVDGVGEESVVRQIPALPKSAAMVYKTTTVTHTEPWFGGPPPSPFFPVSKPPLSFLPIVSPSAPVSYSVSMPAFPFNAFPYLSSSPPFPFSSSSSSSSSVPTLPAPFRQSPITSALPSGTAHPYIMGLAAPWPTRPSLDLNAGPDTIEIDPARQMLVLGASASSSKRFETDTSFDPFRSSTFKQITRH